MGVNRESLKRQHEATRGALLDALLSLLSEGREEEISFQAIAAAAGVSERTVFRYFPSQAALREALTPALSALLGNVEPPADAASLSTYVARLYEVCEERAGLVRTLVNTSFGRDILRHERARRLQRLQRVLATSAPKREPREVRRAAATIRFVASGAAWEFYRHQAGLSLREAIDAAIAVVESTLEGLGIGGAAGAQGRAKEARP